MEKSFEDIKVTIKAEGLEDIINDLKEIKNIMERIEEREIKVVLEKK